MVVHVFSLYKLRPRPLPSPSLTIYHPLSPSHPALYAVTLSGSSSSRKSKMIDVKGERYYVVSKHQ